ncbi:MAG: hypothetical protein DLM61_04440 [Pseudonocardiales bacterium]|nr:MAG: hypothetical protein DLM61_04440 [Pseudonocardiales bacterium]
MHDAPASRVVFGTGRIRQVPDEVERLGAQRALLIAGARQKKDADELAAALGSRVVDRIGEVVMHVPAALATAAYERTEQSGADLHHYDEQGGPGKGTRSRAGGAVGRFAASGGCSCC